MTKDELLKMIEADLDVNDENIDKKIFEVPGLHSKYLRHFFDNKLKLNSKKRELNKLYKSKYYFIKDNADEIMSPKEIIFNVQGDDEYAKLNFEVQILTDLVDILDRTIKKVNNISFDIKNIIAWRNYKQGTF